MASVPWVPEGFCFRSEAAIVSGEAAIVILPILATHNRSFAAKEKNRLSPRVWLLIS